MEKKAKRTNQREFPPINRTIRIGYVGAGFLAQNAHLGNFSSLPQCHLVALAERRPHLAEEVALRFRIDKVYPDHLSLARDPEIDAVAVSADYAGQGEIAADLLRAGKPVFMEKPMAVSIHQAERILAAANEGHTRLMVGYMKRYDSGNRLIRDLIRQWRQDSEKGNLLYIRCHGFCGNWIAGLDTSTLIRTEEPVEPVAIEELLPTWLPKELRRGYIGYLQQYSHQINLLRFLLDAESAEDVLVTNVDLAADGYTGLVVLQIKGVRCVIESASTKFHGWDENLQLFFEGGWIRSTPGLLFSRPSTNEIEVYESGDNAGIHYPGAPVNQSWHYRTEAEHFLNCLQTGAEFDSPGSDALIDVGIFENIYKKFMHSSKE
ncbi:MAG TPA: Gfo/Idh/MocA family oxidoreductase [Chthoniobacterales bacterium]|jgi:predicted dehydrogenase|nr:Gfo/Idh/MocA family oxidoreductase [Chthoniobacterales bacterium]